MPQNPIDLTELAELTLKRVTGSRTEWETYLAFTGRLYRQQHTDQLLIYAQRPDAIACTSISEWNKKGRWVNRGTRGIGLIDSSGSNLRLRYVFDLADTNAVKAVPEPNIWKLQDRFQGSVMERMAERHGLDPNTDIHDFLESISEAVSNNMLEKYLPDFLSCCGDSFLGDLDEHSAIVFFRETVMDSVRTCIAARCGLERDDFAAIRFQHLGDFNTFETASCLCVAVSNISESILREMEREVKQLQEEERKNENERENKAARGTDLQPERGLSDSKYHDGREGLPAGLLRETTPNLLAGTQTAFLLNDGNEEHTGGAFSRDRQAGNGDVRPADSRDDEGAGRDGAVETTESDGVGGPDEQHTSLGTGDHSERSDLHLNMTEEAGGENEPPAFFNAQITNPIDNGEKEIPLSIQELIPVSEQIVMFDMGDNLPVYENSESDAPLFAVRTVPQEVIDKALCTAGNQYNSNLRVVTNYMSVRPEAENIAFLRREFGTENGRGIEHDGHKYAVWFTEEGIRLAEGNSVRTGYCQTTVTWEDCSQRILELLNEGCYASQVELDSAFKSSLKSCAEGLILIARDLSEEGELQNLFPIVRSIYAQKMGFPDCADNLGSYLKEGNGIAEINSEYRAFLEAYGENRSVSRFRVGSYNTHRIEVILGGAEQPKRVFIAQPDFASQFQMFITQDEIEQNFLSDSIDDKLDIYSHFCLLQSQKEKQDYFKSEYRSCGGGGSDGYSQSRSSKGLSYKRSYGRREYDSVNLSFSEIVKIYDRLIAQRRFPGFDALAKIPEYQVHQAARSIYFAYSEAPREIPRPFPELADYYKGVPAIEKTLLDAIKVREILTSINSIMDSTEPDNRYYDMRTNAQKVITEYASGTYDLFGGRHKDLTNSRFEETQENEDSFDDIDPISIRERLEEVGIINGELVDPEKLDNSPFIKQVMADIERIAQEEEETVSENDSISSPNVFREGRVNFQITDDQLGVGGPKAKYAANIAAIQTLKNIERQNRLATTEEQEILSRYVGWGGISQAFDPSMDAWSKEYAELKDLLTEQEYVAARESTLTAFYTPPVIIKAMYQALGNMGFQTGNILDPGCGDGNFIGLLPESMNRSHFYGVEIDSISGRIAQQLYQKASIAIEGYEKTKLPDSFFDLIIGNVPFGQYKVADKKYDKLNFSIHDYFFAKSLDKVRPGGLIVFITSSFTMDKQTANVRRYIAQRAELIGAVRLPNNAFKANAGTDVVSDILFLQKRDRVMDVEPEWTQLDSTEDGHLLNRYFVEHPEMVLGTLEEKSTQYGMKLTCSPLEDADLKEQLNTALSNLKTDYIESDMGMSELSEQKQADVIPADPTVRNFSYCLCDGSIYYRENSAMILQDVSGIPEKRIRGMMEIRDCLRTMIYEQLAGCSEEVLSGLQLRLNTLYDAYVKPYDRLNSRGNKLAFEADSSYPLLCSLEIFDEEGNFDAKADIFSKRTIRQESEITHVDTAVEALAVSIGEKAKVDLPFMAELMGNDITEEDITTELRGVVFLNPETEQWETADEYLSGNVRTKLIAAQHYNDLQDGKYAANVEALTEAQPIDLEASEIDVRLGATWVDPDYIKQFMFELFAPSPFIQRRMDVKYSTHTDSWYVQGKSEDPSGTEANYTYGTKRMNGYELLQDALNLRSSQVYDIRQEPDGEKRVLNAQETMFAQQKQDDIKRAFQDWIFRDPERREPLVRKYNDKFNSIVPRHYDGSHIRFVGMNPEIALRKHQVDAVARALYGGNTLLAHCVGAGKTFTMAAIAMESKRLGLCQKSMFVVPNHLIQDWCGEFLRLYPSANLLMTTEKDFEKANRKKFCARIATGDYDAVIIGHSQFERIPISEQRQEAQLNRQIDEIAYGIEQVKEENGERFTIKQMESLKKQLENKMERLSGHEKKDSVVTYEELGIDKILIDEAHGYKNLFLFTKMRNVAGISQTEAQKSTDLYNKCQFLDELTGAKGIVFATGTPISNSMTELFTMMRYLQSADLERLGLSSFDAWASTFGEVVTSNELAPEGTTFRPKSRFARFYNLPELMNLWREVTDIQTADMLNLPVPEAIYHTEVVEPTEIQSDMVKELGKRAEAVRKNGVDPSVDNMLKITNDGRNLALDQRLIDPFLPDELDTKVNRCIENIYRIWQDTVADRSTQLLFCDLSTPTAKAKTDGFCVYYDVRDKLIAKGIPDDEIAFIHDANTQVKKAALFSKVRSGHVRILLGSTAKMGAGTNVQDKLIALHHLDVPWRPSDIEQREGRIIRQRNENEQVYIYKYVTKNTFDAYSWQTIENKQKFIGQIMTGKSPARSCEDIDSTALSYAEVKALATGNPQIKEKMELEIEVAKLSALKSSHRNEQFRLEDKVLKWLPTEIQQLEQRIEEYRSDSALAAQTAGADFSIELEDKIYTDKKLAMGTLEVLCKLVPEKGVKPIGTYRGFTLELFDGGFMDGIRMRVKGTGAYSFSLGKDAMGNATRLNNIVEKLPELLERSESELINLTSQLKISSASLGKPFPQEQDLQDKTARLNELNVLLSQEQQHEEIELEQE